MKSTPTNSNERLRIVVASELYRPSRGGTETTTENLARGLAALGHDVLVVAPGSSWRYSRLVDDDGQRILRLRSRSNPFVTNLRASWRPYPEIERQLDRFHPDIIQINNHFGIGRALLRYGRKRGIPVVAGVHFMPETFLFNVQRLSPRLYRIWQAAWWRRIAGMYNRANQVVGPSQRALEYLTEYGLITSGSVISNGIDLSPYTHSSVTASVVRQRLGLPDRPTVMYVGRLSPEKQLDVLISGVAAARHENPELDLQLVIVGHGIARRSLERTARRQGVADRVIFTGYLESDATKHDYVAAADLFVIPSTAELQSIVTLEAMASGKPVLAVSAGALPELVKSGRNGELFTPRDSKSLAHLLIEMLQDLPRLRRYGQASRQDAKKHDLAAMPQHYVALYRQLLAKPPSGS
jgi:1,2-diacylglycerol 3-alpha-glucosyltransferase